MAAEITDITQRNQPDIASVPPDLATARLLLGPALSDDDLTAQFEHVLIDLHEVLRLLTAQGKLLARHDALLQEYRPLLDRFAHPLASKLTGGRKRG